MSKTLKRRLADLRAATSINDLIVGRPRTVDTGSDSFLEIDLTAERRIVLKANHPKNPLTCSGKLDWANVTRIKIIHIGGKHEC